MSKKEQNKNYEPQPTSGDELFNSYDYLSNAASKQECTGLIPSEPISVGELESYEDLFHFLPPNADVKNIKPLEPKEKTDI